ncbi:stromal interaction molecule 2 [Betta splendens]|uniref:Stromal interaction molecule 2 n=1 Tax=Betta splendens TaxID=158456 RepID=A0A6P7LHT6_BETSP|nr:stromal interaction molecule 2 [Betta splendens]
MLPLSPLLLVVLPAAVLVAAHGAGDLRGFSSPGGSAGFDPDPCMLVSPPCMSEADRYSLDALRSIHEMMDDDQDGGIEVEESVEFIIEDMKQQQTNKHSNLHREDQHITVEELWRGWKSSEVHNWTQDEVLRWLKEFVELPQYERNFKDFRVNGNTLPRIAANEHSFLSGQLKVQDQRDKQKLNIKALDVVLFGPPTRMPHNYMKDLLLIVSVVMGVGGCWFAQAQSKASKIHIARMMKDLESLQRAEQSLIDLQEQLEQAQEEKRNVAEEKQNLEEKMRDEIMDAQEEAHRLHELRQGAASELSRLRYAEEELEQIRGALKQAEKEMQASWTASEALQQWLQLTHEVEVQYYNVKKQSAELQLAAAKEEAERIKKKRSSVLGTLHVAHSSSLDQVDHKILEAKNALAEVTACLRERLHRWQQIERLCGFPIIKNPGLANLTAQLYSESIAMGFPRMPQSSCLCHSSMHGSIDDLLEDSSSALLPQMPVQPMKRSPRTRGSNLCRSRRHGAINQPPVALISPDPDLLIPIRAPYHRFDEEEGIFLKTIKKQNSQEKYSDTDYVTSPSLSKIFPNSTIDSSHRKLYHDDIDFMSDSSITKPLTKEAELPVHKTSIEELEASVDVSCRKMAKDKLETYNPSLKMINRDTLIETTSRRIPRTGDLMDSNIYRERSDLSLDARKVFRNELDTSADVTPRKISREMMGTSTDSTSKKMLQDDVEHLFDSASRRIMRDSVGMSGDTVSRRLPWNKGECQLDSSVRALAMDKMVDTARTPPRKISRDELEYCSDTASLIMLHRETAQALMEASLENQEPGLDASANMKAMRDELEFQPGSLRRRIQRTPRDDFDSSTDNVMGRIPSDRVHTQMEMPKQSVQREELRASEPSVAPGQIEQPDLTMTSQVPWNVSSEPFTVGPLSQLVYDGILEKSCSSVAATSPKLSASTPAPPQSKPLTELEPPPLPPGNVLHETGDEKGKEKEKGKKSLKLKNLFKKKNDPSPEKLQGGL